MTVVSLQLDEDAARKLDNLRSQGVDVSAFVGQLIREAPDPQQPADDSLGPRTPEEFETLRQALLRDYPTPPGAPPLPVSATDRRATAEFIREHLLRKRKA